MRKPLTGSGVLALVLVAGMASLGFAFQAPDDYPENPGQRTPAAQENSHGGAFDSFGQGYIRMRTEGGKSHVHNITEETQVLIDGEPARLNNLRTGDRIEVTMGPDNVAMKIEVHRNAARPQAASGETRQFSQRPDFEDQPQGQEKLETQAKSTAWLGVMLSPAQEGQQGVPIRQTYPSGPAARAGLRGGEV
jgi:hypothetical protein